MRPIDTGYMDEVANKLRYFGHYEITKLPGSDDVAYIRDTWEAGVAAGQAYPRLSSSEHLG
jgi:hypothetical protein